MNGRIQGVQETEYRGRVFRSKLEAQTAETLDKLGVPYTYEERKIELIEGFRSPFQKDKVRSITYKPDFEIGPIIIECKGFETPEWKIKKNYSLSGYRRMSLSQCFIRLMMLIRTY
jgi:hypothetical protein